MAKKFRNLGEPAWQPKRRSLQLTHTTRLYGVQEAIFIGATSTTCPAAVANTEVEEDIEFMFFTDAISLSGTALGYARACAKPR